MLLILNAIYSENTAGQKNKNHTKHTKTLSSSAVLQEKLSYKENLFTLVEFSSPHIHLTEVTENLEMICFAAL